MLTLQHSIPLAIILLASACGAEEVVEVGIVHFYGESEGVIDAPKSVAVGERFAIVVNTYGAGCNSADSMSIDISEGSVELIPYDREDVSRPCTTELVRIVHSATTSFASNGDKTVTVRGRKVDQQNDTLVEVTHRMTVQ